MLTALGLRFPDDATEVRFRSAQAREARPLVRLGMATTLPTWIVAHVFVALVLPAYLAAFSWCLFAFQYPIVVATLALTYRDRFDRVVQPLTTASNVGSAVIVTVVAQLFAHQTALAAGGVVITIFVGCTFMRLRLAHCVALSLLDVAVYMGAIANQLGAGVLPTSELAGGALVVGIAAFIGVQVAYRLERQMRESFVQEETIARQREAIDVERAKSDALLLNILPPSIVERLKRGEAVIADELTDVSIVFADIVGFTKLAGRITPRELVELLNAVFTRFDAIARRHGVEKIKTIGDAYMGAVGIPVPRADHARAAVEMGLDMLDEIDAVNREHGTDLALRIGIHSGRAVAGVIGTTKFAYDVWGDTVNTASRMESHGVPGALQISSETRALVGDTVETEDRGDVEVKGKGSMRVHLVRRRRGPTAA